ncbi:MAG TPA: helix-turn-helix domain-containing protein [Solirubrobacteraceae bacterium]|nr:helix-turn-helix domain-containing protein [Solirubrobacteraceae bacterium]
MFSLSAATSTQADRPLRADARRNRERILSSALEVFARDGAEAQMDDIAAHASVGVGTLYRHFPTKEALLIALVREKLTRLTGVMAQAVEEDGEPGEVLERALREAAVAAAHDAGMQEVFSGVGPEVFAAVEPEQLKLNAVAGELIARAKRAKAVRDDLEPSDLAMLMCGLGAAMNQARPGFDWNRHLDLIIAAIRPASH